MTGEERAAEWLRTRLTALMNEYESKMRGCARCGCRFFATKRQAYCGKGCSEKERQRRYWARFTPAERYLMRSEKYYAKLAANESADA